MNEIFGEELASGQFSAQPFWGTSRLSNSPKIDIHSSHFFIIGDYGENGKSIFSSVLIDFLISKGISVLLYTEKNDAIYRKYHRSIPTKTIEISTNNKAIFELENFILEKIIWKERNVAKVFCFSSLMKDTMEEISNNILKKIDSYVFFVINPNRRLSSWENIDLLDPWYGFYSVPPEKRILVIPKFLLKNGIEIEKHERFFHYPIKEDENGFIFPEIPLKLMAKINDYPFPMSKIERDFSRFSIDERFLFSTKFYQPTFSLLSWCFSEKNKTEILLV